MRQANISIPNLTEGDIAVNLQSFSRHLRAANLSPKTIYAYSGAVEQLELFLKSRGMPLDVASSDGDVVENAEAHAQVGDGVVAG